MPPPVKNSDLNAAFRKAPYQIVQKPSPFSKQFSQKRDAVMSPTHLLSADLFYL